MFIFASKKERGRRTACKRRFIRKPFGWQQCVAGRRRRPTLLSRMWSEAELAVCMRKQCRPRRGRTAFTVVRFKVIRLLGYTDIPHNRKNPPPHNPTRHSPSSRTAYSVTAYRKFRSRWSLHMRLSKVRPLSGTGYTLIRHTPELRMPRNRWLFTCRKAACCNAKSRLSQGERRPFEIWLIIICLRGDADEPDLLGKLIGQILPIGLIILFWPRAFWRKCRRLGMRL